MSERIPLAGVIGNPVSHSRSPRLHGYWLRVHGITGHYVPLEVTQDDLEEAISMLPRLGFVGVNVTIPHKERVLGMAHSITDRAALIGAANTLIFRRDGRIHADNTDGAGFLANLRQTVPDWQPEAGPAAVFGAGGAARAVIAALLEAGVPHIMIANRTRARAEALRGTFGPRLSVHDWVGAANMLDEALTVVNTTSLGMVGKPAFKVPLDGLLPQAVVADLVYTPLRTALLERAAEKGCRTADGLGMLIHQAAPGFERWFGVRPEVDEKTRAVILGA